MMREFYRAYENAPKVLAEAMTIGWTRNVVILEAELTLQERAWYIQAARQFGWSKLKLSRMIEERAHETTALNSMAGSCYSGGGDDTENTLDFESGLCYTEEKTDSMGTRGDGVNSSKSGYAPNEWKGGGDDGPAQLLYQRSDWPGPARPV